MKQPFIFRKTNEQGYYTELPQGVLLSENLIGFYYTNDCQIGNLRNSTLTYFQYSNDTSLLSHDSKLNNLLSFAQKVLLKFVILKHKSRFINLI